MKRRELIVAMLLQVAGIVLGNTLIRPGKENIRLQHAILLQSN